MNVFIYLFILIKSCRCSELIGQSAESCVLSQKQATHIIPFRAQATFLWNDV